MVSRIVGYTGEKGIREGPDDVTLLLKWPSMWGEQIDFWNVTWALHGHLKKVYYDPHQVRIVHFLWVLQHTIFIRLLVCSDGATLIICK